MQFYNDFVEKVRNMEPLNKRFTSAAIGAGAGTVAALATGGIGFALTLGVCVGSGLTISKYSDRPQPGQFGTPDAWKNLASWAAGYLGVVIALGGLTGPAPQDEPEVIGEQLGMEQVTEQDNVRLADVPVLTYQPA